jgi:outer membrane protein TolC
MTLTPARRGGRRASQQGGTVTEPVYHEQNHQAIAATEAALEELEDWRDNLMRQLEAAWDDIAELERRLDSLLNERIYTRTVRQDDHTAALVDWLTVVWGSDDPDLIHGAVDDVLRSTD